MEWLSIICVIFANLLLESLVFWGIGSLVVYVFDIPFVFEFIHGCTLALLAKLIMVYGKWW